MKEKVLSAFEEVRGGASVDRVIADPSLNVRFLRACEVRGLSESATDLNLVLLNSRKRGGLSRTSLRTGIRNQDAYGFASEIAIRAMERRHATTLDRVLCDPKLAREFDFVAEAIAPGYSPLEYRWAALGLRKSKRLRPELLGRVIASRVVGPIRVADLDSSEVPHEQGLYIFTTRDKVLYVGEARNLGFRLRKHLEHSDNKHLARYIWEFGSEDLFLEYHVLPETTATRVRKAMELELIRSRKAYYNVQR